MRLKRIALPAFVGGFAIVSGFVAMPMTASSDELKFSTAPLDGVAVEATNGWQWHPPMIDPSALPVSLQVDGPSAEQIGESASGYLQRPTDMPGLLVLLATRTEAMNISFAGHQCCGHGSVCLCREGKRCLTRTAGMATRTIAL